MVGQNQDDDHHQGDLGNNVNGYAKHLEKAPDYVVHVVNLPDEVVLNDRKVLAKPVEDTSRWCHIEVEVYWCLDDCAHHVVEHEFTRAPLVEQVA